MINEKQSQVLCSIANNPERAYGTSIARQTGISDGNVFLCIRKLSDLGFIEETDEYQPEKRGKGRPRKHYRITPLGKDAVDWDGGVPHGRS